jgi:hypothetical protein
LVRQGGSLVVVQVGSTEVPDERVVLLATTRGDIAGSHVLGDLDGHLTDRGRTSVDKDGRAGLDLVRSDAEAIESDQTDGAESGGLVERQRVGLFDNVLGLLRVDGWSRFSVERFSITFEAEAYRDNGVFSKSPLTLVHLGTGTEPTQDVYRDCAGLISASLSPTQADSIYLL